MIIDTSDCRNEGGVCGNSKWVAGRTLGLPKDDHGICYMPNAAIGWKQPNAFFYPPAFYSTNLFFDNVAIRHFVVEPLFTPVRAKDQYPYTPDQAAIAKRYCTVNDKMLTGFSDVDRQTVLNDDDGSLTGFAKTISVNFTSPFFTAPLEAVECASDATTKTSPYDYVTTVVYPDCGPDNCGGEWSRECSNEDCYGVPLYRQLITPSEKAAGAAPSIRMSGQSTAQRSTLTANGGTYYIDTTVSRDIRRQAALPDHPFRESNDSYYVFLLFAKPTTKQTYQLYVGSDFNRDTDPRSGQVDVAREKPNFRDASFPLTVSGPTADGILTVTLDMSFPAFSTNYEKARELSCRPKSFCEPSYKDEQKTVFDRCKCSDALSKRDPALFAECQKDNDAVCAWASKDADCPEGGCYGFSVRMGTMKYDPNPDIRPAAKLFTEDPDYAKFWQVFFEPAKPGLAGACELKAEPISIPYDGTARGRDQGQGQGSVTFNGSFNVPASFQLAAAQNVTLNALLFTTDQTPNKDLVTDFPLPVRLVRLTNAENGWEASFGLTPAGPLSPRVNIRENKQKKGTYEFRLTVDKVKILDAKCDSHREIKLITDFGIYDVAPPVNVEVEAEWDCKNPKQYVVNH